ncbi:hypothetical protein F66182_9352 [Fusarium sp. NRRL 66182]|nr:hypothetical protein F66182_9352 [Fusarium sp. NRRL 66182]
MLERTAASLESRSIQRVIQKSANRSRQLYPGFWQHGAAAFDLSSSLPSPPRAAEVEAADSDTKQLQSNLFASMLMLDFLYPSSSLSLLRRPYTKPPDYQEGRSKTVAPQRRAYSSATPPNTTETTTSEQPVSAQIDSSLPDELEPKFESVLPGVRNQKNTLSKLGQVLQIKTGREAQYQEVWDLYSRLDNDKRRHLRSAVVRYLSRSHNIVETGRAISVFRHIPPNEWTEDVLTCGIILLLRSGDLPLAVERFKLGLEMNELSGGLEYLLADTISSHNWSAALDVWIAYYAETLKRNPDEKPSLDRLQQLGTIPKQAKLYFSFRTYLASEGAESHKQIKKDAVSNLALSVFRKHFALMALREPCAPHEACIILENLGDPQLYNDYLVQMFDRWYRKLESRFTAHQLPAVYKKFRELPDAMPAMPVLRGIFKVHFPDNMARLDELYNDWIRFRGGLNQWAYEKFLKLYAHRGDVPAVRRLWDQYVAEFPHLLRTPRAFRSTLNVYAQIGDVKSARAELENMEKYGACPDVSSWSMLLKAYMRANDYEGVLKCFDEISRQHAPDSFVYAHVMGMSSKKGDLDTTMEFFTRSQEDGVEVTKEMALALIVAYCQNGLLVEAETLCAEMTERNLTHTAIWNQLINFNGVEGKIDNVYALLRRMKDFGVEWDDETYEFLLQALVNVNQIHPAYSLLKRAEDESLFLVTPEHYSVVMAGAARIGEYQLVENLHHRLKKSELPVTFSALVAFVTAAARRKPGVPRTKDLGKEFVEYFRQAAEASDSTGEPAAQWDHVENDASNIARLKLDTQYVGRAIALLVELRELGSVEELISLFTKIFPQFQSRDQFPPNIISALMYAHYKDEQYDKVMELWDKTWERAYATSRQRSSTEILAATKYDISRILDVVMRTYKEQNDPQGLDDAINKVTEAGFQLTRANWNIACRYLVDMGKFGRAMYWCEKMLMPEWQGWNPQRSNKEKRYYQNTRLLKAPKNLVFRLQQEWLEMRKMAAWSEDISRELSTVEEKYPRLHHAFTTSELHTMPTTYVVNGKEVSARDLDKVLQSLSYRELIKVKEALRRQLAKEKMREESLGIEPAPKTAIDQKMWKIMLHNKVRRFAAMWAGRRQAYHQKKPIKGEVEIDGKDPAPESPDDFASRERFGYWNDFWDRYDQGPHGARPWHEQRKNTYSHANHHGPNTRHAMAFRTAKRPGRPYKPYSSHKPSDFRINATRKEEED